MKELTFLQIGIGIAAAALLIIKTIHFFVKFKGKRAIRWLYFSNASIIKSQSPETAKHKKIQNALTFVLIVLGFVLLILFFLNKS